MYLKNAGFNHRDVKELRFLCTERFKSEKKYWHFKTMNNELIELAMTGDQSLLRVNIYLRIMKKLQIYYFVYK